MKPLNLRLESFLVLRFRQSWEILIEDIRGKRGQLVGEVEWSIRAFQGVRRMQRMMDWIRKRVVVGFGQERGSLPFVVRDG